MYFDNHILLIYLSGVSNLVYFSEIGVGWIDPNHCQKVLLRVDNPMTFLHTISQLTGLRTGILHISVDDGR